jgi:AcrR family transcriptional regulator
VFAEQGLSVPVDEIARRAGVGAGTLYRHFPTKEALFEAVVVAHLDAVAARGRELADHKDAGEALFDFMRFVSEEGASKRNLIDALAAAGIDVKERASDSKRAVEETFEALLTRAQEAGDIRSDVTIADLFALVMGTCTMGGQPASDASQARMLAVIFDGLKP